MDLMDTKHGKQLTSQQLAKITQEIKEARVGYRANDMERGSVADLVAKLQVGVAAINLRDEEIDAEIQAAKELAGTDHGEND